MPPGRIFFDWHLGVFGHLGVIAFVADPGLREFGQSPWLGLCLRLRRDAGP